MPDAVAHRRKGLASLGVTLSVALLAAAPVAFADESDRAVPSDRFGRLLPGLPPASEPSEALMDAFAQLGRPNGLMDAKDPLERGPVDLITDLSLSAGNRNNPNHSAGATFLGQFIDHDLTRDAGSRLGTPTEPRSVANLRTPRFDLDSVYGSGPTASAELYDPGDPAKLRVESGGRFEDLPRRADGSAIVAEARNDENLIISGLHAAFLLFHNRAVDLVRSQGVRDPSRVFKRARELTRFHYQWIAVHEFLRQIVGQRRVARAMRRRAFFRPKKAFVPVEFRSAAYRLGHSMVRPSYTRISTPLFQLPVGTLPGGRGPASLVHRNLLRGLTWSLPAGQRVAGMGVRAMTPSQLYELARLRAGPRAHYAALVLRAQGGGGAEAGLRLGPVGGRIVAEVFAGLLQLDRNSYITQRRSGVRRSPRAVAVSSRWSTSAPSPAWTRRGAGSSQPPGPSPDELSCTGAALAPGGAAPVSTDDSVCYNSRR